MMQADHQNCSGDGGQEDINEASSPRNLEAKSTDNIAAERTVAKEEPQCEPEEQTEPPDKVAAPADAESASNDIVSQGLQSSSEADEALSLTGQAVVAEGSSSAAFLEELPSAASAEESAEQPAEEPTEEPAE